MAGSSIPREQAERIRTHRAEIDIVWLTTEEGAPWPAPVTAVELALLQGRKAIQPPTLFLVPDHAVQEQEWLTVAEAAKQHLNDVDGLTYSVAKAKISRACNAGKIRSRGVGPQRRIDPGSFAEWRLHERERNLASYDEDHS